MCLSSIKPIHLFCFPNFFFKYSLKYWNFRIYLITPITLLFSVILKMEYNKLWETCLNEEPKHLSPILNSETTAQRCCLNWVDWSAEMTYLRQSLSNRAATEQLRRILSEKGSNLTIKSARERKEKDEKFAFKLAQSAINYPVWWHCRGQKQHFSVIVILLPPSLSSSQHSAHKEETLNLMWTEAKK